MNISQFSITDPMDIIEILARETVKPSSPTPPQNRIYSLSWFDQISSPMFIPILLFYRHVPHTTTSTTIAFSLLKNSLSKTLSKYYPFAGRIRDRESILCNDDGVDFLQAKVKLNLSSLLHNPNTELLHLLFPDNLQWSYTRGSTLLAVQVNRFDCGGLAIGVCMSHKLSDAATVVSFVNCWASTARNAAEEVSFPVLHVASDLFRRGDLPLLPEAVHKTGCYASRRFVFEAEKIDLLKALISGQVQDNPTRVEAVTALLYKSAINASNSVSDTSNTPTTRHLLVQHVKMRPRMAPTLPETAVGSLSWFFPVSTPEESSGMEQFLGALVCRMREGLNKLCTNFAEKFGGEDWFLAMGEILKEQRGLLRRSDQEVLRFSSWCRFPVFESDFRWGKPMWVSSVGSVGKNVFILMDQDENGGGIQVFVTLEEQEMLAFERDQELLAFASCNASVLN